MLPKNHKYLQVEFEALKHGLQTSAFVKTFEGKVNYTKVHNLVVRGVYTKSVCQATPESPLPQTR